VERPIRIGISSCLLGEAVRFDGGHKRDSFLTETLARFVEWVPVCPEVECGLGTPRESMRLVSTDAGIRLLTNRTGRDLTRQMDSYARRRVGQLDAEDLCGYVLKKDSPSCGFARVKVYDGNNCPARTGRGVFAARLAERFPSLPLEEEGRLSNPRIRENFVERIFAYRRIRNLFCGTWNLGTLVRFHTVHKLILMAHSPRIYNELGSLVARARSERRQDVERRYTEAFMAAMTLMATRGRHANVLHHIAGHFKDSLNREAKAELLAVIDDYRRGLVPLIAPVTLVRHHVRVLNVSYLADQLYFEPLPKGLILHHDQIE
jgi:uncharacterized protein YbgA (DUF1722 family)/uncharacterized protein YbbK (DUF523 family)